MVRVITKRSKAKFTQIQQITVQMTTDGHIPNGKTLDIVVDKSIAGKLSKSLFRGVKTATDKINMFIVRDHNGHYVRRLGTNNNGVALASYLFGRTHMKRVGKMIDNNLYTSASYDTTTGTQRAIEVVERFGRGYTVVETMYRDGAEPPRDKPKKTADKPKKLGRPPTATRTAKPAKVVKIAKVKPATTVPNLEVEHQTVSCVANPSDDTVMVNGVQLSVSDARKLLGITTN